MSRRRREGLSPSLFPFLAVLVCTLGTLILFLALVAQNATEAAEQNSRAQRLAEAKLRAEETEPITPRLTAEAVETMIAEERFRVEQFVAIRDSQTSDVEDRRDQLTYLEDQMESLRLKLKRLREEVNKAMGETIVEQIDQDAIEELQAKVSALRDVIEELRRQSTSQTPRVVIVPHKGPNGTDRRAVYLECTDQGITIWPEGSRITLAQLEATRSANPLDAALRVIRLHVMKHYGDTAPPYPLLIVRPDGIESYGAARKAMQDWDDQFGYELVPIDMQLAFSKPDAELKQRVDLAIRYAAERQHQQLAISRDLRGGGGGGRFPTLSAASLDRAGRDGGFGTLRDNYASNSPRTGRSPYTGNSPYTARTQGDRFGGGTINHGALDRGNAEGATRRMNDQMRSAAREMQESRRQSGSNTGGGNTDASNTGGGGSAGDGESNKGEFSGDTNDPGSSNNSGPSDRSPLRDPTGNSGRQPESQPSGQVTSQHAGGNGGSSSSPSSSAMMSPQAGQTGSSAIGQSASAAPPQVNINASAAAESVSRGGRDWGLPSQMVGIGGNAIVRTIRVHCYQDQLVLLPPKARGSTEVFGFSDGDIDRASLQLATAVRDRVERWGAALPGGRWQPRLEIEVMPHSETRFRQLQSLMSGSGVEVTRRASR